MHTSRLRIYLASSSPRRSELLRQIDIPFDVLTFRGGVRGEDGDVDETPFAGEAIEHYVERLALVKATAGWRRLYWRKMPRQAVLAADTAIELDGEIIGKPLNAEDALNILRRMSGRMHRVCTGVALCNGERTRCRVSVSEVWFRDLDEDEMLAYAHSDEPLDKAGAYAIQGRAALFIKEIRGSYSGIMGLPLMETGLLLREFGCID